MERFRYRYLVPNESGIAGTVESASDRLTISMYGLSREKKYCAYLRTEDGMFCVFSSKLPDSSGKMQYTVMKDSVEQSDGMICIAEKTSGRIVLHDVGMDMQRAFCDIWQMNQANASTATKKENKNAPDEPECSKKTDTERDFAVLNFQSQPPCYDRHASKEGVDLIPALHWERSALEVLPYFESGTRVPLSFDSGAFWCFVYAPLTQNPYADRCILGYHHSKDRVDAIAYVIEGGDHRTVHGVPGFKFHGNRNGWGGLWVYTKEV